MKRLLNSLIPLVIGQYLNALSFFDIHRATKKAFRLFCMPRKGQVLPEQESYLKQAKATVLEVNDLPVQTYHWHGNGATLLLMHGWESNTFRWHQFIPKLMHEGFDIVAFDAPAHGFSGGTLFNVPRYADCARKVIETYDPKYILGHSMGGMAMIYNHYKFKNTGVSKMVALGSPSELSDFLRQYQEILGLNKTLMVELHIYFHKTFGFFPIDFSTSKFVKTFKIPALLVHDTLDTVAPVRCSRAVHSNWSGSVLIETEGLGHSLHSDKVRQEIIDFLKV